MTAYYNEHDAAAAHILRAMIANGVIAPGDVDTRSIKEVQPDDLSAYTQCHFFAGGGLWSVAARLAGWPDDRALWTGSCPCQPFSAAGKGGGTDDPRHLWPDFHRLIRAGRPAVVMGEQVAGAAGYGWFDGVRADLEGEGYASRAVDFPACSVDAPHQRNRLYWVATDGRLADRDSLGPAADRRDVGEVGSISEAQRRPEHDAPLPWRSDDPAVGHVSGASTGVTQGDAFGSGLEGQRRHGDGSRGPQQGGPVTAADGSERILSPDAAVTVVQGQSPAGNEPDDRTDARIHADSASIGRGEGRAEHELRRRRSAAADRALRNGTYWSDADWIACHDGKARRAKPGIRFLVDGLPGRVDLWRVGGNAIVPWAAAEVIGAFMDMEVLP